MIIIPKGTNIYRGGNVCKNSNAFFALDKNVAKSYGRLCNFKLKKSAKFFTITHSSLKNVFKYLSNDTRLLLGFIFGTGLRSKDQYKSYIKLFGKRMMYNSNSPGQRLSITEFDKIALAAFYKEYLSKNGYDGAFMSKKRSRFHSGVFHREIYIGRKGLLERVRNTDVNQHDNVRRKQSLSLKLKDSYIPDLFVKYSKGTITLLKHYRRFVFFLGGGMAVKLYLRGRGINTAKTSDFDFKFAVPKEIKSQKEIDELSILMKNLMYKHMSGFVRFLKRNNINASLNIRELKGVPLDKPGVTYMNKKKIYKVYNFSIVTPEKEYELVDTSLIVYPGITRKHISQKWSKRYGMPIQRLTHLWKDTLYILASSFVTKTAKLRNPIDGDKKEKGLKNAVRAGHLSYLTSKRKGTKHLVSLARKLIDNVSRRDKRSGSIHSRQILRRI